MHHPRLYEQVALLRRVPICIYACIAPVLLADVNGDDDKVMLMKTSILLICLKVTCIPHARVCGARLCVNICMVGCLVSDNMSKQLLHDRVLGAR
jgi:hypothetical protein